MSKDNKKAEGRVLLPSTIVPYRYDITITPDLNAYTFTGEETVGLETSKDINEGCKEITMHAKELCFISCSFSIKDGSPVEAVEIRVNLKATTVTFVFPSAIPGDNKLSLKISYTGFLNNQMAGFYRSSYTNIKGEKKIMASTQFEALDARRAFPCWDEPDRKAVFGLTLVVPVDLLAFSNMPESSCKSSCLEGSGNIVKELTFMDSPLMSTYLLAFVIGDFDFVQDMTKHGVVVRVYTPPGKSQSGLFALDCAVRCLDLYDDFFGMPYPLPKLDMVAIPEFAMGAMENWGCVTYREVDLLIAETASSSQKQRVAIVVCHELAHQWFGNLVTMKWWDDLWLNEGFASWTENYAIDTLYPQWKMWDQFTTSSFASALRLDALRSSHPIQVPIAHAEEVEEVFDAISYCKGASVIRMIRAVIGLKFFQSGLANYMKKHQYGNTETFDLWSAWEQVSKLPIQEMMTSWTEQMGFPLLKVTKETWTPTQVTLELEQSWFLSDGSPLSDEDTKKVWCIPILTCTSNGTQSDITLMREKTATITIPLSSPSDFVKLNAGQEVPMRIFASKTMLERLAPAIQQKTLSSCDRAGILLDAYALVKAAQMSPSVLITLLSNYTNETEAVVWQAIEDVLIGLNTIISNDEKLHGKYESFAQTIVLKLTEIVSWEPSPTKPDEHLTSLLRGILLRLLNVFCYKHDSVKEEACTRFNTFITDPTNHKVLPSDIRSSVFSIVLKNATTNKEYDSLKEYFNTATDNADKKLVLTSIGSIHDPKLKVQTMEWTLSGSIKIQDFFYPMGSVHRSSTIGRDITYQYFITNFDKIHAMVKKASPSLMDAAIVSCCGSFCTESKANEIQDFLNSKDLKSNARTISQLLENMRTNASFLEKLKEALGEDGFWDNV